MSRTEKDMEKSMEKDIEKRVCGLLWESFDAFFDKVETREEIRMMDDLLDHLTEAMPYGPGEVD